MLTANFLLTPEWSPVIFISYICKYVIDDFVDTFQNSPADSWRDDEECDRLTEKSRSVASNLHGEVEKRNASVMKQLTMVKRCSTVGK